LKVWDGYDKHRNERTRYDTSGAPWAYFIDDGGAIYYGEKGATTNDPDALRVWCPASMLSAHLMRLYQIKNRKY
jgi:hypothetical protein